jgi:EpsI family protein
MTIAGFSGVEHPIDSASVRVAGMTSHVYRVYGDGSRPEFSLYVGYYDNQTTGRTIHSPRNCLPGAGWQVIESTPVVLGQVTVNRYVLANGDAQALVYYWYQGRGRVAWNEYAVKWDLLRDAARRGRTEEALVRIVVPLPAGSHAAGSSWRDRVDGADALARRVAVDIIPAVDRALPPWDRST